MKAVYSLPILIIIRLGCLLSLIFFVLLLSSCRQNKKEDISIVWDGKQASAILVPKSLLHHTDSIPQLLQIRLKGKKVAVLGAYEVTSDYVLFKPVIPLSRGLSYEIFFKNDFIGAVAIPLANAAEAARIIAVFPSTDTVPENLLKVYFQFSAPMREGEALQHIHLLDQQGDTLSGTFLNLQPELWNKERTVLTLWLDPGRIKRELIPNQQLGNPIQSGKRYTLTVSNLWRDAQGLPLQQSYSKNFFVASRDSLSPEPEQWKLGLPKAGTIDPLVLTAGEPLDYFLLQETIRIINEKGNALAGKIKVMQHERAFHFIPAHPWQPGRYRMQVASYLEDLAGNNLQRLFDRDITAQQERAGRAFAEKQFAIRN